MPTDDDGRSADTDGGTDVADGGTAPATSTTREERAGDESAACDRADLPDDEVARIDETVSGLLSLLGKAHTMAVLREFADADAPLRFSDIEDALGISPNTLSERLKELTAAGLLTRTAYNEIPPRVEYEATPRAEALFPVFRHLVDWARDHELDTVET
jgi:DNA-binding HxlR family transcriptional regulator